MPTDPVDQDLFRWALGGAAATAGSLFGWVFRRQERLDRHVDALAAQVEKRHQAAETKRDNDQADLWQALDAHRKESRDIAAEQQRVSREFRERTLRELGDIRAGIASLAANRAPPA